jgi:DNA-binding NtrC family response regulator
MTRIKLNTQSASQRLALRRWLEASGHEICPDDDPHHDLLLGDSDGSADTPTRAIPYVEGQEPARIDFEALHRLLVEFASGRRQVVDISGSPYPTTGLVTMSPGMRELSARIDKLAPTDLAVLITGESGSGKELVAKALHERGPRRDQPFVAVNCAAIPDTLFESELFGHERGSFTDAGSRRHGHFERAGAGTLFLDEIAEIPGPMQAKLLRALEDRNFLRLGGEEVVSFNARVISATRTDPEHDPGFRPDLYHRIAGAQLRVPPLRERREDLPELCRIILSGMRGHALSGIDTTALEQLTQLDWPGNVRQLENLIRHAAIFATGPVLDRESLDPHLGQIASAAGQYLDSALQAWSSRRRAEGAGPAELREELLERLAGLEEEDSTAKEGDSSRTRPAP